MGIRARSHGEPAQAGTAQRITERHPEAGLVHHSDRGVQYASLEYVAVLQEHQIIGSMSRSAYPYDNARLREFHADSQTGRDPLPALRHDG